MKKVSIAPTPTQQRLIEAEANVRLRQLMHATPAQVEEYMSQIMTLGQAREVLTALALAVRFLYLNR